VPQDTATLTTATLHCDIQAQETTTGEVRTVWVDELELRRDITRDTTTSVDIHTTQPPYPASADWDDITGKPSTFTPSAHTHVSADITDASEGGNGVADAGKLVKFKADGSVECYSVDGNSLYGETDSGQAVYGSASSGIGVLAASDSGTGLEASADSGTYHATFGYQGNDRSAIERVRGWFVWFYSTFTGRLKTADITANREWTMPDASGTVLLDANASTTGGISKIWKSDEDGNFTTGTYTNDGTTFGNKGNIFIPDQQGIRWLKQDGTFSGSQLRHWEDHDGYGGETILDSPWRIALIPYGPLQLFPNDPGRYPRKLIMSSGVASSANAAVNYMPSAALAFQSSVWTGSANARNDITFQAKALDATGTNSILQLFDQAEVTGEDGGGSTYTAGRGDVTGNLIAEFYSDGIWSRGSSPEFDTLTDGATINVTCSKYKSIQVSKVTLGGNRTLAFSGLLAGMRGIIYVTQDGTGSRSLTPSGGSALGLSTAAGTVDRVSWHYDGIYTNFTVEQNVTQMVLISDADALAFLTAASITELPQKAATDTLVQSLKSASLWSKLIAIYPFIGGSGASHAVNLKAPGTYDISWVSSPTHNSNGVTGNGSSAYGATGINLNTLGMVNSVSAYAYSRTQTPTDSGWFLGANIPATRFGMRRSGTTMTADGPNDNSSGTLTVAASSDFRKHFLINRSASNAKQIYANNLVYSETTASVSAPSQPLFLLARNNNGTPASFSNVNLAFAAIGESLSESEFASLRTIVDTFQASLGRANP
jgi:hypothetical protein